MKSKIDFNKLGTWIVFAGPSVFFFFAVIIIPLIYGGYLTFTNWDGISAEKTFVGLANYMEVLKDIDFWNALKLTLLYAGISVITINIVGFLLAYLLSSGMKGQNFMRAGFFTPNLIGGIVLGFIWQFVFGQVMVYMGSKAGIESLSVSWLSDPTKAFWALVIVTTWQYSGYMMLIYLAGLTEISQDVVEASAIDGCTGLKQLRYITLPLMTSSFVICLFLSISRTFMVYDLNISFTGGGPYGSTIMAAMHVFRKAFTSKAYGVGQAEALILFLVTVLISVTQTWLGKRKEVEA